MSKNLDSTISPTGPGESIGIPTGVKKLNKIPLAIIAMVLITIILGLGYATMKRAEKSKNLEGKQENIQKDGENLAIDFISKLYQSRTIHHPPPPLKKEHNQTVEPIKVKKSLTIKHNNNIHHPTKKEALKKRLLEEKLALERYKRELYKTALTAPTKVSIKGSSPQTIKSNIKHISPLTPPNPADIYAQVANAYKSANSPSTINQNEQFLKSQGESSNYLLEKKRKPLSPYELKTGTLIPSILITEINSDLPGPIKAQVSENVFDTATGEHLLIPQGSTLIGHYSSNVQYGQSRVLIAFNQVVFPDGQSLNLQGMNGINQQGAAGFNDHVNNHYFRIFGSAILMGAITGGVATADTTRSDQFIESNRQKMVGALISELGQVARQMIQKNMNISPTLEIRAGYRFNIFTTKDIILEPLGY